MRYVLIDNALVRSDDIADCVMLDTPSLFMKKKYYGISDYNPVFEAIEAYLSSKSGEIELVIGTHFYFLPCFVRELQNRLSGKVCIIPIYALLGERYLREVYDNFTIETKQEEEMCECSISPMIVLERTGRRIESYFDESSKGIPTILKINNVIDTNEKGELSLEEFNDFFVGDNSYQSLVEDKSGFTTFSPYSSLKFYDIILPQIRGFDAVRHNSAKFVEPSYKFSMTTFSGDIVFEKNYQSWVIMEKGSSFVFQAFRKAATKLLSFIIPDSIMEESEISLNDLRFGKFFIDVECDFFGNLHIVLESLSGKTYYNIIPFAS